MVSAVLMVVERAASATKTGASFTEAMEIVTVPVSLVEPMAA